MKKRIFSIVMAAAMVASFTTAAFAGETEAATEGAAAMVNPADIGIGEGGDVNGDGKVIVGYISKNLTDPFHAAINDYAAKTMEEWKESGFVDDVTGVLDGETDPNKQIDRAQDCISKGCDYVIFLPAEAEASDPALQQLTEAGVKVIEVNSASTSVDELAMGLSISNDVEAGEMLANWVLENVPDGGKYIHCTGILGNSAQVQRGEGIENVMKDHPEWEKVGEPDTQWDGNLAANATSDAINTYGDDLKAVICDNDGMSSASQKMANSLDRSDIICVGVDGIDVALQMVKEGTMKATVLQDGVGQVTAGFDMVKACINGESFDPRPQIPFVLVTADNVDQYYSGAAETEAE